MQPPAMFVPSAVQPVRSVSFIPAPTMAFGPLNENSVPPSSPVNFTGVPAQQNGELPAPVPSVPQPASPQNEVPPVVQLPATQTPMSPLQSDVPQPPSPFSEVPLTPMQNAVPLVLPKPVLAFNAAPPSEPLTIQPPLALNAVPPTSPQMSLPLVPQPVAAQPAVAFSATSPAFSSNGVPLESQAPLAFNGIPPQNVVPQPLAVQPALALGVAPAYSQNAMPPVAAQPLVAFPGVPGGYPQNGMPFVPQPHVAQYPLASSGIPPTIPQTGAMSYGPPPIYSPAQLPPDGVGRMAETSRSFMDYRPASGWNDPNLHVITKAAAKGAPSGAPSATSAPTAIESLINLSSKCSQTAPILTKKKLEDVDKKLVLLKSSFEANQLSSSFVSCLGKLSEAVERRDLDAAMVVYNSMAKVCAFGEVGQYMLPLKLLFHTAQQLQVLHNASE